MFVRYTQKPNRTEMCMCPDREVVNASEQSNYAEFAMQIAREHEAAIEEKWVLDALRLAHQPTAYANEGESFR